ncbi:MAG TPA: hypothetical protein VHZ74_25130, partial [Bryobacteraceae bacterium]|nr:hypothetical protein [Bryobacteraceae bacterium]
MRSVKMTTAAAGLALLALCIPTDAQQPRCTPVNGDFSEFVITPFGSPNDPLGRVVIVAHGTINAIGTAILTSVGPGPTPGTLGATTKHVFLESEQDQLAATGSAVFTPIPGSPNVTDLLTLTINGGTGKYSVATGTI